MEEEEGVEGDLGVEEDEKTGGSWKRVDSQIYVSPAVTLLFPPFASYWGRR